MTKFIVLLSAVLIVLLHAQAVSSQTVQGGEFCSISRKEVELLISDVAIKNPAAVKRLSDDPKMKAKQLENLKELFAFASQAEKDGLADEPTNKQELSNIRFEVIAVNYDSEINKDKVPQPAFGFITDVQMKQYWDDAPKKAVRDADFQQFFAAKLALLKRENPGFSDPVSPEDMQQARDYFAKIHIYFDEYETKARARTLGIEFVEKTNLQVKLQQAQFLAKLYSNSAADKATVTDDDIVQYISKHSELDPQPKRTRAMEILKRAKAGEDFATLANQFTEDPGNKGTDGKLNGGLYSDVRKGVMVAPFERAALALEPGQVSPDLVESDFGFHIIKLEKKADIKDGNGNPTQTYDVRHILIETMYSDPGDPTAQPRPVRDYVKEKLADEKQKKLIEDIVAANHISVPDDYTIPVIANKKAAVTPKKPTTAIRKTPATRKRTPARKRTVK